MHLFGVSPSLINIIKKKKKKNWLRNFYKVIADLLVFDHFSLEELGRPLSVLVHFLVGHVVFSEYQYIHTLHYNYSCSKSCLENLCDDCFLFFSDFLAFLAISQFYDTIIYIKFCLISRDQIFCRMPRVGFDPRSPWLAKCYAIPRANPTPIVFLIIRIISAVRYSLWQDFHL